MILGLSLAPLGACATSGDLDRLELRVRALERDRDETRQKMAEDMARLDSVYIKIQEAEKTLRESGADLGIRFERVEQDLPRLKGDMESFSFRLNQGLADLQRIKDGLADRIGWTSIHLPTNLPQDREGLLREASQRAQSGQVQEAKAIYELYISSYTSEPETIAARQALAQLLESSGDIQGAITAYRGIVEEHDMPSEEAKATYRIGELLILQGRCDRAESIFRHLLSEYPNSPEAAAAKARILTVSRECDR